MILKVYGLSMLIHVYLCLSMFIYVHLCSSIFINVFLCLSVFIYVYLCLSVFIYVDLCRFMLICVFSMFIYVYQTWEDNTWGHMGNHDIFPQIQIPMDDTDVS